MPPPVPSSPRSPSFYYEQEEEDDDEDEDDRGYFEDFNSDEDYDSENPATTPFICPSSNARNAKIDQPQFSVLAVVMAALGRSLVTCSVTATTSHRTSTLAGQQTSATFPPSPSTVSTVFSDFRSSSRQMSLVKPPTPVLVFLEFLHVQCSVPMTKGGTVYRQSFFVCKAVYIQAAASKQKEFSESMLRIVEKKLFGTS